MLSSTGPWDEDKPLARLAGPFGQLLAALALLRQVADITALIGKRDTLAAVLPNNKRLCHGEIEPAGMLAPAVQATTIDSSVARVWEGVNGRKIQS